MKAAAALAFLLAVALFLPQFQEGADSACAAVERKTARIKSADEDPMVQGFAMLFLQASNGALARAEAKKRYPNVPAPISCTLAYYSLTTFDDSTTAEKPSDSPVAVKPASPSPLTETQGSPDEVIATVELNSDSATVEDADQLVESTEVSFDCSSSDLTDIEQAICGSEILRTADGVMAGLYKRALNEGRTSVAAQQAWLLTRASCSASSEPLVECLKRLYSQRIGELFQREQ
jgi:hypothetical protein